LVIYCEENKNFSRPDGKVYEGEWYKGKQHGKGVFIMEDGQRREGEWKNGNRIRWMTEGLRARLEY